jgi:simple sugar transport system permease protein
MDEKYFLVQQVLIRALSAGTPLLLGTLGEIYSERSGILNLGIEGMMAVGAVAAFATANTTGNPWMGVLAAAAAGGLLALLHAFSTVTLKANQIVSGLALTMLGLGISGLWGKQYVGVPLCNKIFPVPVPLLSQIPIVGNAVFNQDYIFYGSVILGILLWFILYKTKAGIVIRSTGENPEASDSLGISVWAVRYACVVTGGLLAGLAGSYLSLVYIPSWVEGMTGGRGWIVIALTVFSLWNPGRAFLGAYLFGGIYVLQYILQSYGIPPNLLLMLPYASTILVLLVAVRSSNKKRVAPPASLCLPFDKNK